MKEILKENADVIQKAGEALVEIGSELAEGLIDNVFERLEAEQQKYKDWKELDQTAIDIEQTISNQKSTLEVQQILTDLIGTFLGTVIRKIIS